MPTKERFSICSHIRDKSLYRQHNRYSTEQENESEEESELPDTTFRGYIGRVEVIPGDNGAEEHEQSAVENQVDDCWERQFFCFLGKPAVVCESYTCSKSNQEVITAEERSDAYGKDGEKEVKYNKGWSGNVASLVRETEESVGTISNYETQGDAEDALPEDGDEDPFFDCLACAGVSQSAEADIEEWEGDTVVTG
jgi:hypothetical protein